MKRTFALIQPLHRDGWGTLAALVVATLLFLWLWAPLGWLCAGAVVLAAIMMQDPRRAVPHNLGLVVSPADGKVRRVDRMIPPVGLHLGTAPLTRIEIALPVLGPHVVRAPILGRVAATPDPALPGPASLLDRTGPDAGLVLALAGGGRLGLVLSPWVGRITLTAKTGDSLQTGQRLGLIRFGGSLALYLPEGLAPQVAAGQQVVAGETGIALVGQDAVARVARLD